MRMRKKRGREKEQRDGERETNTIIHIVTCMYNLCGYYNQSHNPVFYSSFPSRFRMQEKSYLFEQIKVAFII